MTGERWGRLINGNTGFDLRLVRRCGARNRAGGKCGCPAMANGRCRLHGGKSTGAKTAAGKERARLANYKHGQASKAKVSQRKERTRTRRQIRVLTSLARKGIAAGMTPEEIDRWLMRQT